jgi:hypothetical protein
MSGCGREERWIQRRAGKGTVTFPGHLRRRLQNPGDARMGMTNHKATNPRRVGGLERDKPISLREKP